MHADLHKFQASLDTVLLKTTTVEVTQTECCIVMHCQLAFQPPAYNNGPPTFPPPRYGFLLLPHKLSLFFDVLNSPPLPPLASSLARALHLAPQPLTRESCLAVVVQAQAPA